jgi:LacI family transcriptional regulator
MHEIMEHARRRIPDDISVLGVGNDPDDCEAMHPPLSSVILPTPHMGESAATMLHRLIRGRKPESSRVTVTPIGIKVRQSSDIFATLEPRLQRALLFIRNNCEHPLSPRELIRVCGWNRRTMERSFRIHLDRSPLEEIHRARMQKAQELMQAGLSVTETSQRLGFKTLPHFSRVFRSVCQTTPRQYTKQL